MIRPNRESVWDLTSFSLIKLRYRYRFDSKIPKTKAIAKAEQNNNTSVFGIIFIT